jgi:hypothetical protein
MKKNPPRIWSVVIFWVLSPALSQAGMRFGTGLEEPESRWVEVETTLHELASGGFARRVSRTFVQAPSKKTLHCIFRISQWRLSASVGPTISPAMVAAQMAKTEEQWRNQVNGELAWRFNSPLEGTREEFLANRRNWLWLIEVLKATSTGRARGTIVLNWGMPIFDPTGPVAVLLPAWEANAVEVSQFLGGLSAGNRPLAIGFEWVGAQGDEPLLALWMQKYKELATLAPNFSGIWLLSATVLGETGQADATHRFWMIMQTEARWQGTMRSFFWCEAARETRILRLTEIPAAWKQALHGPRYQAAYFLAGFFNDTRPQPEQEASAGVARRSFIRADGNLRSIFWSLDQQSIFKSFPSFIGDLPGLERCYYFDSSMRLQSQAFNSPGPARTEKKEIAGPWFISQSNSDQGCDCPKKH